MTASRAPARAGIEANLSLAGLPLNSTDTIVSNFARYLGEFYSARGESARVRELSGRCDFEPLRRARSENRGALLVTAHFGNWELGAMIIAEEFGPLAVIIRTTGDPSLDARIRVCRGSNDLLDVDGSPRAIIEAFERRRLIAAAIDEPRGEGEEVEFFGQRVFYPAALFRMAARTGAAILPTRCGRDSDGRIAVTIEPEVFTAQDVARRFEAWIRADPGQWMLMRRFA